MLFLRPHKKVKVPIVEVVLGQLEIAILTFSRYLQLTGNSQKRENRYFQLTGDSEKTLKSLFPVDWR